ncbi:MAG: CHAD domain-containing protein [Gammaproteobacteria bacterium]|nr:CHAD domain-containing protein [Gammaproteobacteria bacterium]
MKFEYEIGKSVSIGRAKEMLRDDLRLVEISTDLVETTYMDSFDWRLYSASAVIESEQKNGSTLLRWRDLNSHNFLYSETTTNKIGFASKLPVGAMQERLSKVLKLRALLSKVCLRVKRYHWVKLDREEKTVLKVTLEEYKLWDNEKASFQKMGRRIRLKPIRGYQNPLKQADKILKTTSLVEPASIDIYLAALKYLGREPGDYKPKSIIHLPHDMRTDEATKKLLLSMLDMLNANEDGVRNNIDSEFLHDFRIAVRKSRSAFNQIKNVFPRNVAERFRKQLAWLGTLTSPARDMDVYLLKIGDYRYMLPVELRGHLEPLRDVIVKQRKSNYNLLVRGLNGKRYERFLSDYRKFLHLPVPVHTTLLNAPKPVKEVSDQRIWKMYRRVMKEGQAITLTSPDEELHELRKTCKKLRYLIEFFQSLYDSKQMAHLIETLKKLQDNLGDFNDLHVQMGKICELRECMKMQGPVSEETDNVIAKLNEKLNSLQSEKRKEFSGKFRQFCEKGNINLYKQLFKSK